MVGQAKLKSFHPDEATRAARIGWNALFTLANMLPNFSNELGLVVRAVDEMNKNGMFDKPGEVLQGPIEGDIGGTPVTLEDLHAPLSDEDADAWVKANAD